MQNDVSNHVPDFVVNSTKNIALISFAILLPFTISDLIQGQYAVAIGIAGLQLLYLTAAYRCHIGNYSLKISLFGIAPVITLLSALALYKLGISASFWSFAALFVLYFVLPLKFAAWFNITFIFLIAPIAYEILALAEFFRFIFVLIGTSGFVFMCIREIHSQNQLLAELSTTDSLTGLRNRTTLNESVSQAISINQRYKTPVTLLMVDVDNFKAINDQYGHNVGDETLKNIARLMRENFRDLDVLFRMGGEEFLVILHETTIESAKTIAERFRLAVQDTKFIESQSVTVSIGLCERTVETSPQAWMSVCDKRLYRAKQSGRNKTVSV